MGLAAVVVGVEATTGDREDDASAFLAGEPLPFVNGSQTYDDDPKKSRIPIFIVFDCM